MSQIGVVVGGHCELSRALIASAEMIAGAQQDVATVCLSEGDNLESCRAAILAAIAQVDHGKGAIILIDLFGGTPSNAAALSLKDHEWPVVAGVNLPMLIEVLMNRDSVSSVEALSALAVEAGCSGIIDVAARMQIRRTKPDA